MDDTKQTTTVTNTVASDGRVPKGSEPRERPGPRSYKERVGGSTIPAPIPATPAASLMPRRATRLRRRSKSDDERSGYNEEESDIRSRSRSRASRGGSSRRGSVSSREADQVQELSEDEEMEMSDASRTSSSSTLKRKRGRPQSTGDPSRSIPCDYHHKLARKAKKAEEEEAQKEKDRCDPSVKPAASAARKNLAKTIGTKDDFIREFRIAPTADIQAQVLEVMDRVDKGAVCSNNIKGTVVKDMRRAAAITRAAMTVLSLRTDTSADTYLTEQMEEMRTEMAAMRRENERLRIQLDSLRKKLETQRAETDRIDREVGTDIAAPVPLARPTSPSATPSISMMGRCAPQQQQ